RFNARREYCVTNQACRAGSGQTQSSKCNGPGTNHAGQFHHQSVAMRRYPMSGENQELRKAGLKVTLPRVKIMQILEGAEDRHLSAEDVYKALRDADEDVGLATVYRVLTQFETAGLVMRHHFDGGHSVFEM